MQKEKRNTKEKGGVEGKMKKEEEEEEEGETSISLKSLRLISIFINSKVIVLVNILQSYDSFLVKWR